jgi:hypothetical protein
MMQSTAGLEQAVCELRRMLPAETATAQAIDRGEPCARIAAHAVADGYIDAADDLVRFLEACLKRNI